MVHFFLHKPMWGAPKPRFSLRPFPPVPGPPLHPQPCCNRLFPLQMFSPIQTVATRLSESPGPPPPIHNTCFRDQSHPPTSPQITTPQPTTKGPAGFSLCLSFEWYVFSPVFFPGHFVILIFTFRPLFPVTRPSTPLRFP